MKIFQIVKDFCFCQIFGFPNIDVAKEFFSATDMVLVEAPDNVFEGWGYVNGEFIKPNPPSEDFVYDEETGHIISKRDKVQREAYARINELKDNLYATDYKAIKYAEGLISEAEYAPIKAERQAWRDEINALEAELEGGT